MYLNASFSSAPISTLLLNSLMTFFSNQRSPPYINRLHVHTLCLSIYLGVANKIMLGHICFVYLLFPSLFPLLFRTIVWQSPSTHILLFLVSIILWFLLLSGDLIYTFLHISFP